MPDTVHYERNDDHIAVSGAVTVKTARKLYDQTPQFYPGALRVDLQGVSEADSAGLALLVHWSNLATAATCELTFASPPDQLRELAKIMKLDRLFGGR